MSEQSLHVFTDGDDFVVATDPADAEAVMVAYNTEHEIDDERDPKGAETWRACDPKKVIKDVDENESKTYDEWALDRGRGHLYSTNW